MEFINRIKADELDHGSVLNIVRSLDANVLRRTPAKSTRTGQRREALRTNMGPEGANLNIAITDPNISTAIVVDRLPNSSAYRGDIPAVAQPAQVARVANLLPGLKVDLKNNTIRLLGNVPNSNECFFYLPCFTRKAEEVGKYIKQRLVLTNLTGNSQSLILTVNDQQTYTINSTTGYFSCNFNAFAASTFCYNKITVKYSDNSALDLFMQQFDYWKPIDVTYVTWTGSTVLRNRYLPVGGDTTDTDQGLKLMSMDLKINETNTDPLYPFRTITVMNGATVSDETYKAGSQVHKTGYSRFDKIYSNYLFNNYPTSKPVRVLGTRFKSDPCYVARVAYFKTVVST